MESSLPLILLFIIGFPLAIFGMGWVISEYGDQAKEHLIGLVFIGIIGVIIYFLVIGGVLFWPILNILAYLKVLIFPSLRLKKYGSKIALLNSSSFDQEITTEDKNEIKKHRSDLNVWKDGLLKFERRLSELGSLPRNKDGSISQRSNAGKEGYELTESIRSKERDTASS